MVKYIVDHTNAYKIGTDVDEIVIGNKGCQTSVWDMIDARYKKYVSTIDVIENHLLTECLKTMNFYPKIILISDNLDLEYLGLEAKYKYELLDDCGYTFYNSGISGAGTFIMSIEMYRKYYHLYPEKCSQALAEHEKLYYKKEELYQYQSDYDIKIEYS